MITKNEMKNEREIEMTLDYNTLKKAARDGLRLGNWNGKAVFAASASSLDNLGTGAYYILYDDENKIVARDNSGWKSYGEVGESGSVHEYSTSRVYHTPAEVAEAAVDATYAPGYDISERPTGDVKMGIDVEATLRRARELSIDDLLVGFLPNVDFNSVVAKG